ncbi:MAG: class I SAM-dependent methyltransferase [Phycisphaerales bacterium]|nr:class I SAM-dependent methyltransferase [Phycisphaerales bacterium]
MGVDGIPFNAPASVERIMFLLARLQPAENARILDVGCGRGAMLAMLAASAGIIGTGIDPDLAEITIARERPVTRGQLEFHCATFADVPIDGILDVGFDAALCIGATHAFGPPETALPCALHVLRELVRTGGRLLIGEGYWRRPPEPAYLAATGLTADELRTHDDNIAAGKAAGLEPVHSEVSSAEEWDDFEDAFLRAAEHRHAEAPDDADAAAALRHWQTWNAAYHRWGRETMGFGFYIFEV